MNEKSPIERWMDFPPAGAKQVKCDFCGGMAIKPCRQDQHDRCGNFTGQGFPKKGAKK